MVRVVGLDVSRGKATVCIIEEMPIDLLEFARSYKPLEISAAEASKLPELGDVFALEPTGSDHRIFAEVIKASGKPILGVTGVRVRSFAKDGGLLNKADREDAACIAAYSLRHLQAGNPKAFISVEASEIRELFLPMKALKKQRATIINQLRARLVYEMPEIHEQAATKRRWGVGNPPHLWRLISGQEPSAKSPFRLPEQTLGRGISELSRQLAEQICNLEMLEYALECECDRILEMPEFEVYRTVFDSWEISEITRVAILSAIYPVDQFLDNGKLNRKRVHATKKSKHNKTTRDRSLKAFKRAIGAGQMLIQSGKKEFWMPTGDKTVRSSIYAYLEAIVVVRRQPSLLRLKQKFPELEAKLTALPAKKQKALIRDSYSFSALAREWAKGIEQPWRDEDTIAKAAAYSGVSKRLASLQLFYELAPQCQNRSKTERVMKVYPRFVTGLFRDLVSGYQSLEAKPNRTSSEKG